MNIRIRKKRPGLRLIVSSATLDATKFLDYFTQDSSREDVTIVSLEGRMYPVEVAYLQEPTPDYVRKAAETAWNINLQVLGDPFYIVFYLVEAVSARSRRCPCVFNWPRRN